MVNLYTEPDYTASNLVTGMARRIADLKNNNDALLERIRVLKSDLEFQKEERQRLEQKLMGRKSS